ncbi:lectin-like domain-containing protein, partial [Fructobacillus pseudoficulneus]
MSKKNNLKNMQLSDKKERYKAYKSHKTWLYAAITGIASIVGCGSIAIPVTKADSTSSSDTNASEVDSKKLLVAQSKATIPAVVAASQNTTIEGTDYSKYFTANGNASIKGDTATLTPHTNYQKGNTILNTKVDLDSSFTLTGSVNLGTGGMQNGGADGVGFVFQPGDTNIIGNSGNAFGIGGIANAFGFKLDTYNNPVGGSTFTADPQKYIDGKTSSNAGGFGAFIYTDANKVVHSIDSTATSIPSPSGNNFLPITISYVGSTHVMNVNYNGQIFSYDMTSYLGNNTSMSFAITASTGNSYNLQQFKLTSFDYTIAKGKVTAHYVDTAGKTISDDIVQQGDLGTAFTTTQKTIPGYTFKSVTGSTTGSYTANDQTVTYVYSVDYAASDSLSQSESTSDSNSDSLSDVTSTSDSTSNSLSDVTSTSDSTSNSLSDVTSTSDSTSNSLSDITSTSDSTSNSLSDVTSTSDSISNSLSDVTSTSDSVSDSSLTSDSVSGSASTSESVSDSASTSDSSSDFLSDSNSQSDSVSDSSSLSDSISDSMSNSDSLSDSLSDSGSTSDLLSNSVSDSGSTSDSLSDSVS